MGINGQSELREKYARLLIENRRLKEENEHLKAQLKLTQTESSLKAIFPAATPARAL
ncbi:MAG: hypothetical protein JXR78_18875 [Victivallales bacterium]|nr:hypothetical protein [Victivallales bacterium]